MYLSGFDSASFVNKTWSISLIHVLGNGEMLATLCCFTLCCQSKVNYFMLLMQSLTCTTCKIIPGPLYSDNVNALSYL